MKNEEINLTRREKDILYILWNAGKPIIASEIAAMDESLTISTVQSVLKKLLNKKLIEVADIVHSNTVLSRRYRPTLTLEEFENKKYVLTMKSLITKNITTSSIIATFIGQEDNPVKARKELEYLEMLIKQEKEKLSNKEK